MSNRFVVFCKVVYPVATLGKFTKKKKPHIDIFSTGKKGLDVKSLSGIKVMWQGFGTLGMVKFFLAEVGKLSQMFTF